MRIVITMIAAFGALMWISFNINLNALPTAPIVRLPYVKSNKLTKTDLGRSR